MSLEENPSGHWNWRRLVVIAFGVLFLVLMVLVLLVLTGIIAEPETIIESIVRALLGQ